MKRYLRCLLAGLAYVALFMVMATGMRLLLPFTGAEETVNWPLLLCPFLVVLLLIWVRRRHNTDARKRYFEERDTHSATLWADCKGILLSGTFRVELLAYVSYILPFTVAMCVKNGSVVPVLLLMLLLEVAVFVVIDTVLWLLVHLKWRGDRVKDSH